MNFNSIRSLIVITSLIAASAVPAFADDDKGKGKGRKNGHYKNGKAYGLHPSEWKRVKSKDKRDILTAMLLGDQLKIGNTSIGQQFVKVVTKSSPVAISNGTVTATITLGSRVTTSANSTQPTVSRNWEYFDVVDRAPSRAARKARAKSPAVG